MSAETYHLAYREGWKDAERNRDEQILARIERMADGYHFAGLLSEEATVREVLARLRDSKALQTNLRAHQPSEES